MKLEIFSVTLTGVDPVRVHASICWLHKLATAATIFFFLNFTHRRYSDGKALLERRESVDIVTGVRGYSDGKSVDIATGVHGYSDGSPWI